MRYSAEGVIGAEVAALPLHRPVHHPELTVDLFGEQDHVAVVDQGVVD